MFLGHSVARNQNVSEATAQKIDAEVRRLVEAGYAEAQRILTEKREDLHALAKALLEFETLSGDEIKGLLNGKPPTPRIRDGAAAALHPRFPPPARARPRPEPGTMEPQPQA